MFDHPLPVVHAADPALLSRARGALLGQLAGDALGAPVEFRSPAEIRAAHPGGLREMIAGGTWDTLPGQLTDDSELALAMARSIVRAGGYDADEAALAYSDWLLGGPFTVGGTIRRALSAAPGATCRADRLAGVRRAADRASLGTGALMRVAPLGVYGWASPAWVVAGLAREDASITHPGQVCQDANAALALTIARAVAGTAARSASWAGTARFAARAGFHPDVQAALAGPPDPATAESAPVVFSLANAFHQLRTAASLEAALVDTVMLGGDTDTNAAITGALLGAAHGEAAVPDRWRATILNCRPRAGDPGVRRPRPREYWAGDVPDLAERLAVLGSRAAGVAGGGDRPMSGPACS